MKRTAAGLAILALAANALAADGKAVYDQTCAMCHATGLANAPKYGDKAAWGPRIATGRAALLASATNGKGAMPAKGGNAALSAEDLGAAIDYMVSAAK